MAKKVSGFSKFMSSVLDIFRVSDKVETLHGAVQKHNEYVQRTNSSTSGRADVASVYSPYMSPIRKLMEKSLELDHKRKLRYKDYELMDEYSIAMASALDIYADEVCQFSYKNERYVWADAKDSNLKKKLDQFLTDLDVDNNYWAWTRETAKMGDLFLDIHLRKGEGGKIDIISLKKLDPAKVQRVDDIKGRLVCFFDFTQPKNVIEKELKKLNTFLKQKNPDNIDIEMVDGKKDDSPKLQGSFNPNYLREFFQKSKYKFLRAPWDIIHIKVMGPQKFEGYGDSVLESGRIHWKRLKLLEESLMVYRLLRAADRLIYYVYVGDGASKSTISDTLEEWRASTKRFNRNFENIDSLTVEKGFNPLWFDQDLYWPVMGEKTGSRVEVLPGSSNVDSIADIEYFNNKLIASTKIPKSYLGFEGDIPGKATLSAQSQLFAKAALRVQTAMIIGLFKVMQLQVIYWKMNEKLDSFKLGTTIINTEDNLTKVELMQNMLDIGERMWNTFEMMQLNPKVAKQYVLAEIFRFNDDMVEKLLSPQKQAQQSTGAPGMPSNQDSSGAMSFGPQFASMSPDAENILNEKAKKIATSILRRKSYDKEDLPVEFKDAIQAVTEVLIKDENKDEKE